MVSEEVFSFTPALIEFYRQLEKLEKRAIVL